MEWSLIMKTRAKSRHNRAGFTLVEIVVATFLLLLGLTGIHQLMLWMMFAAHSSGQNLRANSVAQDKMEELLDTPYTQIAGGNDTFQTFTRIWTVDAISTDEKEITVDVSWDDIRGNTKLYTIKSIMVDESKSNEGLSLGNIPLIPPT